MNKASCLSLLSNAVLVWNTVRMGEIVARLRAAGESVSIEDLARISPLAYAHAIPNGTYVFDRSPQGGTLRPIRYRLQQDPDSTAKSLMARLRRDYPGW